MSDRFYTDFAAGLVAGPDAATTARLSDPADAIRLAIYRNNVVSGAIEALRAAYPVVNALVGPRFFSPLAKAHWLAQPPRGRSLTLYGAGFDRTIAAYEPARSLPYLSDVARLDRAWLEAHHAADDPVLQPDAVGTMPPGDVLALAPGLHASTRLLTLDWPVHAIWCRHRDDAGGQTQASRQALQPIAQHVLVWRPFSRVQSVVLPADMACFLSVIAAGGTLEEASLAGLQSDPGFQPAAAFGAALSAGYLSGVQA